MNLKDYRRLRRLIPPRKNETCADYMTRITDRIALSKCVNWEKYEENE